MAIITKQSTVYYYYTTTLHQIITALHCTKTRTTEDKFNSPNIYGGYKSEDVLMSNGLRGNSSVRGVFSGLTVSALFAVW